MASSAVQELLKTSLYDVHRQARARMVPFGGWDMPVQYRGIVAEHLAVREGAGLFDLSHMGRLYFQGQAGKDLLQWLSTNNVEALAPSCATTRAVSSTTPSRTTSATTCCWSSTPATGRRSWTGRNARRQRSPRPSPLPGGEGVWSPRPSPPLVGQGVCATPHSRPPWWDSRGVRLRRSCSR
jgi:hypothetical protein